MKNTSETVKGESVAVHTPGPWKVGKRSPIVGVTVWRSEGDGVNYRRICRNVSTIEDANLIAGSPALLQACKTALFHLDSVPYDAVKAREVLETALHKATGGDK